MEAKTSSRKNPGIITIERHILHEQESFPDATGALTQILYSLALAGKLIASRTTRAGLADILGSAGEENIQGEEVQKLDIYANRTIVQLNNHTGRLAVMASEEEKDIIPIPDRHPTGKYVLLFDPLDGSSNIDYNVSVGTIFAIYRRKSASGRGTLEDVLQKGADVVAGGYMVYGSSTMLVYSTGNGVNGFTLDPNIGEFLLSHENIRLPEPGKYYSANQGYTKYWTEGIQRYTRWLQGEEGAPRSLSLRYIGSMVSDIHRTLLSGGVFYYPSDTRDPKKPHGKLRLLYEAVPMAYIIEQAGGYGSTGRGSILDVQPTDLHQRTPLFLGNKDLVEKAEEFIAEYDD
ncbi:MAG: class 1 fructose-bisphosphatase [Candidatus Latescibacteria bacterium]|nr:class 1 fructose-bisphosphatase [Candidatus Latescibacterota bacterium]NIO27255.1 class 1 fructose-bisphosphatase [Candidatus Latescibacterota bacterium]NIO54779.1 class 1 fructose-bisphosphatase [Candidatus Latescibacterota bacterium]NIT00862.1 class 1 fructose-bisphosphatase [Candidatus Latescibacterota bacterium]NIT37785.1 class 1 fructose-bisphosphatase [Candidatus Latescibacterota bacterium]